MIEIEKSAALDIPSSLFRFQRLLEYIYFDYSTYFSKTNVSIEYFSMQFIIVHYIHKEIRNFKNNIV